MSTEENARLEYTALMSRARDAERMSFLSWMAGAVAGAMLLASGMASRQSGFMLPVVLVAAWGLVAMSRCREQAMLLAGYLEMHHESEDHTPAFYTRLGRMQGVGREGSGREWHPVIFLNALAVVATGFAWTVTKVGARGELWAGIVTGSTLALLSWSVSETSRIQQTDWASHWERAEGGLHEVKRRTSAR
jgi:hypothetical protein